MGWPPGIVPEVLQLPSAFTEDSTYPGGKLGGLLPLGRAWRVGNHNYGDS